MAKKKIHYFALKNITLSGAILPGQAYNAEYVLGEYLILRRKNEEPEVITEPDRISRFHEWSMFFVTGSPPIAEMKITSRSTYGIGGYGLFSD